MNRDLPLIKCPICGTEYLPSEIYLPKSFFGAPGEIIKRPSGEVDFYTGTDMDLDEEFVCESCLTKLKIHANISFNVDTIDEENFNEDYCTPIDKPKKIKLEETDLF